MIVIIGYLNPITHERLKGPRFETNELKHCIHDEFKSDLYKHSVYYNNNGVLCHVNEMSDDKITLQVHARDGPSPVRLEAKAIQRVLHAEHVTITVTTSVQAIITLMYTLNKVHNVE
jgi:hypothetical protein